MKNWKLTKSLQARGWTTQRLAESIYSSRCQVSLVLNNTPGRGALTRPKLARLLTAEELELVGWDRNGEKVSECESGKVSGGAGSTGNNVSSR